MGAKITITGSKRNTNLPIKINHFYFYVLLVDFAREKFDEGYFHNWTDCPFTCKEIGKILRLCGIPDDCREEVIDYCISQRILEKNNDCFYLTIIGLAQYEYSRRVP